MGDNKSLTAFHQNGMMEITRIGTAVATENKMGGRIVPCYAAVRLLPNNVVVQWHTQTYISILPTHIEMYTEIFFNHLVTIIYNKMKYFFEKCSVILYR
jgi:hypothetical protein